MTDREKLARFNDVWVCTRCGLVGGTLAIHRTKCDYEPAPSITIDSLIAACEARGWEVVVGLYRHAVTGVLGYEVSIWTDPDAGRGAGSEWDVKNYFEVYGSSARAALEAAILMALEANE